MASSISTLREHHQYVYRICQQTCIVPGVTKTGKVVAPTEGTVWGWRIGEKTQTVYQAITTQSEKWHQGKYRWPLGSHSQSPYPGLGRSDKDAQRKALIWGLKGQKKAAGNVPVALGCPFAHTCAHMYISASSPHLNSNPPGQGDHLHSPQAFLRVLGP